MSENHSEHTGLPAACRHALRLATATTIITFAYPLTMAPAFKLCFNNPRIAAILHFQVVYHPLTSYLGHHPYSRLDNLSYWYATQVWRIPMVRN